MRAKSAANDNIIIDSEFAALIPPLLEEEHIQLLVNIVGDGCHEPLSIWDNDSKHVLIDGHNRHDICTKNHIPFTTTLLKFEDRDHVKVWIGERQLGRRNLTDDQRAVVANDMRETLSALARSEQAKAARAGDVSAKSTDTSKKDTRAAVAVESKLPERKLRLAQEIKKASSDVYNMVRAGTVKLTEGKKLSNLPEATRKTAIAAVVKGGDVRNAVRGAKKQDYNDRIAITKPKILEGTYRIIYVDPPWKYVGLNGNDDHGHAEAHYDCLDDEQLKAYSPAMARV
jgi:hypothetical protein